MITKPFSRKKLAARLSLLLPVIAVCLLLFNNKIVAKPASVEIAKPSVSEEKLFPVPGKFSSSEGRKLANSEPYQDHLFFIEVEGEKIRLDGEEVKLQEFPEKLDEITSEYSEEEIKNRNIRLRLMNIPDEFAEKLNKEYKKTRYFKLIPSEEGLFHPVPPAPPAPPRMEQLPAPPTPPAYDEYYKEESRRAEAMEKKFLNDSIRVQEVLEKRVAIMQEREKQMEQRQEEFQQRQQEMLERLQESEERHARVQERKEELEQRLEEIGNQEQIISQYLKEREKLEKMLPDGYPAAFLNLSSKAQEDITAQLIITMQFYFKLTEEEKTKVPHMFVPPPSAKLYEERNGEIVKKTDS